MRHSILRHVRPFVYRRHCGAQISSYRQTIRKYSTQEPEIKSEDELGWPARFAFGALTVAVVAVMGYEVVHYRQRATKQILEPATFSPFVLTAKEPISATCSIFHITPQAKPWSTEDPYLQCWNRPVWSVQTKQPQLQIARSYTPLPPVSPPPGSLPSTRSDPCTLRFLIRQEEKGELSGYLHRLPVGAAVELRGPQVECELPTNVEEVVFFAGGTGIAPAMQIAHALRPGARGLARLPRMRIIWANRRREDCEGGIDDLPKPQRSSWTSFLTGNQKTAAGAQVEAQAISPIVEELERLKVLWHGRLTVDYHIDEEGNSIDGSTLKQYIPSKKDDNSVPGQKVVLVSGPDGFVKHLAGSKEWRNGIEQQGPLGGLLKDALPGDWTTVKL